jgi:hypothetical protein
MTFLAKKNNRAPCPGRNFSVKKYPNRQNMYEIADKTQGETDISGFTIPVPTGRLLQS